MHSITSSLSRFASNRLKKPPSVINNTSMDAWFTELGGLPARQVAKVELCTAMPVGKNTWGENVDKRDRHAFLRAFLDPVDGHPQEVMLVERFLSTGDNYHSVVPLADTLATGGTMYHPEIRDRVCTTSHRYSNKLARKLVVERTLEFDQKLSIQELGVLLQFVSRTTTMVCPAGDCKYESNFFAYTCLAALAPVFPPVQHKHGSPIMQSIMETHDTLFEDGARDFLEQVPFLIDDVESTNALRLMEELKKENMHIQSETRSSH